MLFYIIFINLKANYNVNFNINIKNNNKYFIINNNIK